MKKVSCYVTKHAGLPIQLWTNGLPLDTKGWRTERKSDVSDVIIVLPKLEINMAEYGDGPPTSSRDAPSAIAVRSIDEYSTLFEAWTIFRHIYCVHKRTTMTSETSEKHDFRSFLLRPMLSNTNQRSEPMRQRQPPHMIELPLNSDHLLLNLALFYLCATPPPNGNIEVTMAKRYRKMIRLACSSSLLLFRQFFFVWLKTSGS